eukprot:gene5740-11608_t
MLHVQRKINIQGRSFRIIKLVHEKYLRHDLGCGYMCGKLLFPETLRTMVSQSPHQQMIIVDTNIALHQIDILEYNSPATSLIIILQTVLQEIRHLNISIFHRLCALLNNETKQFLFYPNELSLDTDAHRKFKETINDANDRAIRVASTYFQSLLKDTDNDNSNSNTNGTILLITNDKDNLKKALEEGLICLNMKQYISKYIDQYPELLDLLAADSSNFQIKCKAIFPSHHSLPDLMHGLQTKKLLKGTLRCKGRDNVNRALDGDVVVIQIIPDHEINATATATATSNISNTTAVEVGISDVTAEATPEAIEGISSSSTSGNVQATSSKSTMKATSTSTSTSTPSVIVIAPYGRVVGILKRTWKQYAGSIDSSGFYENGNGEDEEEILMDESNNVTGIGGGGGGVGGSSSSTSIFVPVDKKMPKIRLFTRRRQELIGFNSLYPLGHCVRVLGKDNDKAVETMVLLHEYGVPNEAFTTDVMSCLPPSNWRITDDLIAQRTDIRHIPVVSIDPPGCKDIDDALHCRVLPNGHLEVGVHIADVTYFVHPNTPLDKEAAHRSTSTYLVDRRLDMLPGYLTTELCSLRSKEDHLAFTVLWEMDRDANIIDVQFFKSVIHSVASLTYDQAQSMLDAPTPYKSDDIVGNSVRSLNTLARILRKRRIDMGALTLASPEVRFKLDTETDSPTDVCMYALKEANALVEEFMLLANITVSKKILRHFPTLGVLRRHQPPSREQFAPLLSAASAVGVHLDISSSKTLADSLDKAVNPDDPYFNKLLRILSTRCMMPAQYFCSGEIPKDQWHHYGLAAPVYTHFTSPIRRYADIIVHRRHKAAQYAQRASVTMYTLLYF